jgi:hypothetical protein
MVSFSYAQIYVITYTNVSKGTITIPKEALLEDILDVTLIGKSTLEYGELFDENVLHLLENFACPEDASALPVVQPDLSQVSDTHWLRQPTEGQFWFNKTDKRIYAFTDASVWVPLRERSDFASASGIISDGATIPLPEGITLYSECSIFVSPQFIDQQSNYVICYVDAAGKVTMQYRPVTWSPGQPLVSGLANYIILGNKSSSNHLLPTPTPSPTPAIITSVTPTATVTPTPTPAPAVTVTPTPSFTPSATAAVTPTLTVTPTVTRTITPTPTLTPTPSFNPFTSFTMVAGRQNNYISAGNYFSGYTNPAEAAEAWSSPRTAIGSWTPPSFLVKSSNKNHDIGDFVTFFTAGDGHFALIYSLRKSSDGTIAPADAITQVKFTDKDGILRTYSSTAFNSNVRPWGTREWYFFNDAPTYLFEPGNSYVILIE